MAGQDDGGGPMRPTRAMIVPWLACVVGMGLGAYGDTRGVLALTVVGIGLFLVGFAFFALAVFRALYRKDGRRWTPRRPFPRLPRGLWVVWAWSMASVLLLIAVEDDPDAGTLRTIGNVSAGLAFAVFAFLVLRVTIPWMRGQVYEQR